MIKIDFFECSTGAKFPDLCAIAHSEFNIIEKMFSTRFYKHHITYTNSALHSYSFSPLSRKTPYYFYNFNTKDPNFFVPISSAITLTRCDLCIDFPLINEDPDLCPNHSLAISLAQRFSAPLTLEIKNRADGSMTSYFGKRKSNIFIRVYTKPEVGKVRFEIEFKPRLNSGKMDVQHFFEKYLPNQLAKLPSQFHYFPYKKKYIFPTASLDQRKSSYSNSEISQIARFSHLFDENDLKGITDTFNDSEEYVFSDYIKYWKDDHFKTIKPRQKK